MPSDPRPQSTIRPLRAALGGVLLGLANLLPGVSGGTMLLALGLYPDFVRAVADVTTLRWRLRSVTFLGLVVAGAAVAILMAAGPVMTLVEHYRPMMYSLFIGFALGAVPFVVRCARPVSWATWSACGCALALMGGIAVLSPGVEMDRAPALLHFAAGGTAAAAMVLPGISGSYLLLLFGEYEVVLGAIEAFRHSVVAPMLGSGTFDAAAARAAAAVLTPFGLGVVLGVAAVSRVMSWTLSRFPSATYGILLGLLLGSIFGLWPFDVGTPPHGSEIASALACALAGFLIAYKASP